VSWGRGDDRLKPLLQPYNCQPASSVEFLGVHPATGAAATIAKSALNEQAWYTGLRHAEDAFATRNTLQGETLAHPFLERLARGPILADGATGTMLHGRGAALDASVEGLTLSQPDWVREIHLAYIQAGAEIIQTNTFAGSSLRLAEAGLDGRVRDVNFRAVKLARYNIHVNAIAPGFFHTDMMGYLDKPGMEAVKQAALSVYPIPRMGEEDDIKGLAVFLASRASDYMTGAVIPVDGGFLAK